MTLQIRKLSHALGAEITGVDISKPLNPDVAKEIYNVFLEHCVLLVRGQALTQAQHVAFSRWFGEVDKNKAIPTNNKSTELPEIKMTISRPKPTGEPATGPFDGQVWHTDRSHQPAAAAASLLRGVEVPEIGGDTMFCNMYRAYETLSDGMKKLLEGLHGVHVKDNTAVFDNSTPERAAESRRLNPAAVHPVVRVHPETGRKALYLNEEVKLFVGMTAEESRPLIQYLTRHAVRPQNVYRHQWQKDDLVAWDNRCLLHIALGDFDRTKVRHMERTTINGAPSGYVYEGLL